MEDTEHHEQRLEEGPHPGGCPVEQSHRSRVAQWGKNKAEFREGSFGLTVVTVKAQETLPWS